ncbi:MAG: histidine kinase [Bifidobacteriaceae bacterium]|nr:histidine kinase [Bifidobacteriaceae bacterium]
MERVADKAIVLALCLVAANGWPMVGWTVVAGLAACLLAILGELRAPRDRFAAALDVAFCLGALMWPPLAAWCALPAYDLARRGSGWWAVGIVPVVGTVGRVNWTVWGPCAVFIVIAVVLAGRTGRAEARLERYRRLRDELSEASHRMRRANRDLAAREESNLRLATLDERARIAREIHDTTGHLLTRSLLQVEALRVSEPELAAKLAPLGQTLDSALDAVRSAVHDLRDAALDLGTRLETLADGTELRLAVDYDAGELPGEVAQCFWAVAQEAVANTLRHSDATELRLAVVAHPGIYQLVAQDNGTRPGSGPAGRGMGLATMEERARALGGVFATSHQGGFRVFVSIPRAAPTANPGI